MYVTVEWLCYARTIWTLSRQVSPKHPSALGRFVSVSSKTAPAPSVAELVKTLPSREKDTGSSPAES